MNATSNSNLPPERLDWWQVWLKRGMCNRKSCSQYCARGVPKTRFNWWHHLTADNTKLSSWRVLGFPYTVAACCTDKEYERGLKTAPFLWTWEVRKGQVFSACCRANCQGPPSQNSCHNWRLPRNLDEVLRWISSLSDLKIGSSRALPAFGKAEHSVQAVARKP